MEQLPPLGTPLEHFKLLCDYIKFHIGLYVATPAVFAVIAKSLSVDGARSFLTGLTVLVALCFISGLHASWFMASRLNRSWQSGPSVDWEADAANPRRRFMQHYLFWFGLLAALAGLIAALADKA